MWTLPNILSLGRLALLPAIILLIFIPLETASWGAFFLFAIGAVTDFFDGFLARRLNQVSEFGVFIDPISDKIYVALTLIALIAAGHIQELSVVLVLLIITREFLVSGIREYLGPRNIKVPVTFLAKFKTTAQLIACGIFIIAPLYNWGGWIAFTVLLVTTALTLYTGWSYLKTCLDYIEQSDSANTKA